MHANTYQTGTYVDRRARLETYFDRTAAAAWARLTSDAKLSGIRATVRAGRDEMRATLLSWLPQDLTGRTLLDAGCGTGALAVEAARRGAHVTAIDLSATLVALAAERASTLSLRGTLDFQVGDMLGPDAVYDHVVAMDSMIHYRLPDMAAMIAALMAKTRRSMLFTFAPRTPMLTAMHAVGRLFPRADRAPAIEPVTPAALHRRLAAMRAELRVGREHRVATGFYTSQALELSR